MADDCKYGKVRVRTRLYVIAMLGVLFTVFGAVWLFSANAQEYFMDKDYGQWSAKMDMMRRCDVGDVAIIGDSRASAGILPNLLRPAIVRNLALTGASPIEGYFEMQRVLACPRPPRAVILSYASRQYEEVSWFWQHAGRYGFLSFEELQEISQTEQALGAPFLYRSSFGSEPPALIKNWLYAHNFPPFNFGSIIAAHGFLRKRENDNMRSETLRSGGYHSEGPFLCAAEPDWIAQQPRFVPAPIITLYFERMIELAQSRGMRIAILPPPISDLTDSSMAADYRSGFVSFMAQIEKKYPDILVLGDAFPAMDKCLFADDAHLNTQGADVFTRTIAPRIAALLH